MKTLITAALLLTSLTSFAQVSDFNILLETRGDMLSATQLERLQGRIRMGFVIDAAGLVEIVGLASTGPAFNNDWNTLNSNPNAPADDISLAFRNIYLRKVLGKTTLEAGALSPEPVVGAAGLGATGWMDGVRVKVNTKIGDFKIVAGSLGDFKTPNAFSRNFNGNFFEIEMDHKIFETLMSQTALELYNGDTYVRESLQFDLKLFGDRVLKTFADALYDVERSSFNYEVGAELDALKSVMGKFDNRLKIKVYVSHIDENIPNRTQTVSAFYTPGTRYTMQVGGKIDRKGDLNWYARASLGESNRYDVGINYKIPLKKKKPILPN